MLLKEASSLFKIVCENVESRHSIILLELFTVVTDHLEYTPSIKSLWLLISEVTTVALPVKQEINGILYVSYELRELSRSSYPCNFC